MSPSVRTTISAQPGPQTGFLRSAADICIYGGAAGGGKTVGLVLEPMRYVSRVPGFTAVFFRRTTPQITNPGGLWDESQNFYPRLGGTPYLRPPPGRGATAVVKGFGCQPFVTYRALKAGVRKPPRKD